MYNYFNCNYLMTQLFKPRYSIDPVRKNLTKSNKKIKHFVINETSDGQFFLTKGTNFRAVPILIDYYRVQCSFLN